MREVDRAVLITQTDARAWVEVDPDLAIGNVFTSILHVQQKEVICSSLALLDDDAHDLGFDLAMSASIYALSSKLDAVADDLPGRMNAVDLIDIKHVQLLNRWFAAMQVKDTVAENWGFCVRQALSGRAVGKTPLTATWAWLPALGYPREWFSSSGIRPQGFGFVPDITEVRSIARLMLEFDRHKWEPAMFDALRGEVNLNLGIQTPRGQTSLAWSIFGVLQLAAFYATYLLAAIHLTMTFDRQALELILTAAIPMYAAERTVLEAELAALKELDGFKARHYIDHFFDDALRRGTAKTRFGDMSVVTVARGAIPWPAVPTTDEVNPPDCSTAFLVSLIRTNYTGRAYEPRCIDDTSLARALEGVRTPRELVRALDTLPPIMLQQVEKVAGVLGWAKLSAENWVINLRGANFNICDGRKYRFSPVAALLGLQPVLSLGNIKAWSQVDRRSFPDFLTDDPPTLCPLVADLIGEGEYVQYQRDYMPDGMSMGEDGLTRSFSPVAGVDVSREIGHFYRFLAGQVTDPVTKQPVDARTYMVQPYGRMVFQGELGRQSDWDPEVSSSDRSAVLRAVHSAEGVTRRTTALGDEMVYMTSATPFLVRFPCRLTPSPKTFIVSERLGVRRRHLYDGHVIFDGVFELTAGPGIFAALAGAVVR